METIYYDEEAEKAVIGSMLENNKVIPGCFTILGENAFLRVPHQIIFDAIGELTRKGDAVDAITVGGLLERKGELNRIGGAVYLYDIVHLTPTAENAEYYAKIVRDKQILRQLVSTGKQIAALPSSQNGDASAALLAQAQQLIMAIDTRTEQATTIVEQVDAAYQAWLNYSEGNVIDIATGFKNFDILTGGFERKDLTLIGGYPSVGKSAWLYNTVYYISVEHNRPCCLFSYEDKVENIINRMVSTVTGLNPKWKDDREQAKTPAVLEVFKAIQKSALKINDTPPRDISELIIAIQRESLAVEGLAVVAVDNIQLVKDKTTYNSEQETANITGALKNVAKLTNVAVVATSHLSREAIKIGRRPMLSDLRYSGMAEGNADKVVFVHREDYGEYEYPSPTSDAEIIVAKGRNNAIGSIPMKFHRGIFRFEEA